MSRPRALITGASAGIGREFARVFAAHGYDLILVARRQDQLESLRDELESSGADIVPMARDLALKTAPKALHQEVRKRGLAVDVLVNNAGVTFGGAFTSMDADAVQSMVLLNAANLAMLTRLFVADMIGRGNGRCMPPPERSCCRSPRASPKSCAAPA
jgi:short-subunit dehydrogenase